MTEREGWGFHEGDEVAPGLIALRRLGGGSAYEVYLAWSDRLYAIVAAKLLRPGQTADRGSLRGLRREAATLERLAHPVVVRMFEAALDGDRPHIVLEHLEGPTLSSLLRRYGALAIEQLLPLALHICAALHYLGTERTVHLDVKPGNIVMGAPPRLIDLSVARTFEEAARISSPVGTDAYMAPEQCAPGPDGVGPAADVFGLGATLFEAVAGETPFPRGDRRATGAARFPQLVHAPEALDEQAPPSLAEAIAACLERDPAARPAPSDLALRLEPLVAALPTKPVLRRMRPRIM